MDEIPTNRPRFQQRLALAVFAAAVGVYLNGLPGAFIYDDHAIIEENPLVRGRASLAGILASSYWERGELSRDSKEPHGGLYRPVTILSYSLNRQVSGLNPLWFHLTNITLHGASALLLFLILGMLGFSQGASVLGALAFAVLPVHAEAVSWTIGRAEILGALFVMSAWLLLHDESRWPRLAAGLGCYALALLSKESAAPFPAVLILGEFFRHDGDWKELVRKRMVAWLLPFGVLVLYLAWRQAILGAAFMVGPPYFSDHPRLIILLTMAKFFFHGWLIPMASGLGLCADYSRPVFPDAATTDPGAWGAVLILSGVTAWALGTFLRKRSPWAFSALTFLCFAAPLSNLLVPMEIIGAERIIYLPSIGFCLSVSAAWDFLSKRGHTSGWGLKALAAGCLLGWSFLTMARNRIWRSDETFYAATKTCAPDSPHVLLGLGMTEDLAGRHAEARDLYRRALTTQPKLVQAAYNMGKSFYEEEDWRNAKEWFQRLESRSLADKDALCFLGLIAEREGALRKALSYYARAIERDPAYPDARRNMGLLLYKMGDVRGSIEQLRGYLNTAPPGEDVRDIEIFLQRIDTQE